MPDAPGLELIRGEIEQDHPGAVLDTGFDHGRPALVVDPAQILAVLGWLRDAPGQEYRFLSSLHAADYLPAEPRFGVHYELLNRDRVERLRVKAMLADPAATDALPEIDSCVELFPTAEFQEREVYRLLRDRLPRPPRPDPDPAARRLRRLAAAARLPGRRRARHLHLQRAQLWLSARSTDGRRRPRHRGDDGQHRAAPPGHARRAAAGRRPRRRGRARPASR